ncbi:MAG: adenylyltransferase/cytidyltransferase family protein [Candidatus Geothermarchaeales archaeon]
MRSEEADEESLARSLELSVDWVRRLLSEAGAKGRVLREDGAFSLTPVGRRLFKVGMMGGVFDILHLGHLRTLEESKRHCDVLVVVIATAETVMRLKGRTPLNDGQVRREMVSAFKAVDVAILGDRFDRSVPFLHVRPDVVFLGHDQTMPGTVGEVLGREVEVRRLNVHLEGKATTDIIKKISGEF